MRMDSDGDGQISREEAPEPMQDVFDRLDENGDGFIDLQEVEAMRARFRQGGGPGSAPSEEGFRGPPAN